MKKFKESFNNITMIDYLLVGAILLFAFLSYQHSDIRHTAGASATYLNGHILDFYDEAAKYLKDNNYMPTTFILFAIWNIPMRLLGKITIPTMEVGIIVRLWYKLFTTILYFITAFFIYKICRVLNIKTRSAKITAFIFITNPIAIYSQFIISQYDIITTLFITIGIYYWLKNDTLKFIGAFAIAVTCKYFALLFFLPLLLIKEKNIFNILYKTAAVGTLFLLETLIYIKSDTFVSDVFGFGAINHIFTLVLNLGPVKISVTMLAFILLCGYSYFKELGEDCNEYTFYILGLVTFISFGLSFFHPQWLLIAVPVWVIGTVLHKNVDVFLFLDVVLMFFHICNTISFFKQDFSEGLFSGLVWTKILGDVSKISENFTMYDLISGIDQNNWIFSGFAGVLAVYVLFKMPKYLHKGEHVDLMTSNCTWMIRLRYIVGTGIFIIPSLVTLYINYTAPSDILSVADPSSSFLGAMKNNKYYDQKFIFHDQEYIVSSVSVYTGTYRRSNDSIFVCELYDSKDNLVTSTEMDASLVKDNDYTKFIFSEDIPIEKEAVYTIRFYCKNVKYDLSNAITIAKSNNSERKDEFTHAVIDGIQEDYNLNINLIGLPK